MGPRRGTASIVRLVKSMLIEATQKKKRNSKKRYVKKYE